jgi:hypothetical protein
MEHRRVTTVLLGTNTFIDCGALLAVGDDAVVRVDRASPPALTLKTPPRAARQIAVHAGRPAAADPHVAVVESETMCAVFYDEHLLAIAVRMDDERVHLTLDLRPVGVLVYTDPEGLHVGPHVIAKNTLRGSGTAIALAAA